MQIVQIRNIQHFNKILTSSKKPIVALFSELWVEKCKQILDVLLDISCKYPDLQIVNIRAEEMSDISKKYRVDILPTVIIFKNNIKVYRIDGYDVIELHEKCKTIATNILNNHVEALINKAKVMVFIEGSENLSICENSKEIVEILNKTGVPYTTFDVSSDQYIQKGLKEYWPTFPQVFVNGELKGGLIIIKHLGNKGELVKYLKG